MRARMCPVSSETDGIKLSMVYLQSDAKELLQNDFRLHQYTASNISGGLWTSPGKKFVICFRAVLSRPSEWPECQHRYGVSVLVSVVRIKEKSQCDKSGEYSTCGSRVISCTDKNSFTDNAVYGRTLSFRRNHFLVAHNWGKRRRIPSRKLAVHLLDKLVYSLNSWNKFLVHYTSVVEKSNHLCFCFRRQGKRFLRGRRVFVSRLFTLSFRWRGRTVGTVFHPQRLWKSGMYRPFLQFPEG